MLHNIIDMLQNNINFKKLYKKNKFYYCHAYNSHQQCRKDTLCCTKCAVLRLTHYLILIYQHVARLCLPTLSFFNLMFSKTLEKKIYECPR